MTLPIGNWGSQCDGDPQGHWFVQDGDWTGHCEYCDLEVRLVPEEVPE